MRHPLITANNHPRATQMAQVGRPDASVYSAFPLLNARMFKLFHGDISLRRRRKRIMGPTEPSLCSILPQNLLCGYHPLPTQERLIFIWKGLLCLFFRWAMPCLSSTSFGRENILKGLQRLGHSSSPLTRFPLLSFNVCSGIPTATVPAWSTERCL